MIGKQERLFQRVEEMLGIGRTRLDGALERQREPVIGVRNVAKAVSRLSLSGQSLSGEGSGDEN